MRGAPSQMTFRRRVLRFTRAEVTSGSFVSAPSMRRTQPPQCTPSTRRSSRLRPSPIVSTKA
jgi:hypothetical protein